MMIAAAKILKMMTISLNYYIYLFRNLTSKFYLKLLDVDSLFQVIVPHGEPVTVDTFLAWRERFEAELALERAK